MRRREFIAGLGAATWAARASGQTAERMRRIGVLMNLASDDPEAQARIAAFRQELQQLGWTDGRDVRIDDRWAGDASRFHGYAEELLALAPDVTLASAHRRPHCRATLVRCGSIAPGPVDPIKAAMGAAEMNLKERQSWR